MRFAYCALLALLLLKSPSGRQPVLVQVHRQDVSARAAKHLANRKGDAAQRRIDAAVVERIVDAAVERGDNAGLPAYVSGRAWVAGMVRLLDPHALAEAKAVRWLGCGHAHLDTPHPVCARAAGVKAGAAPTRLSVVTSRASSASLQPSVPRGRRGSTIQRTSLVLSWTRTSTVSGSRRLNRSASVPRGSRTMRSL